MNEWEWEYFATCLLAHHWVNFNWLSRLGLEEESIPRVSEPHPSTRSCVPRNAMMP